jgi:hypothetical protein
MARIERLNKASKRVSVSFYGIGEFQRQAATTEQPTKAPSGRMAAMTVSERQGPLEAGTFDRKAFKRTLATYDFQVCSAQKFKPPACSRAGDTHFRESGLAFAAATTGFASRLM